MLVDSHCHLNMRQFADNIDDVIQRAKLEGVTHMQTICTKKSDICRILEIANKYENVFASIGIHPNESHLSLTSEEILAYVSKSNKIIGIGETGLDFFREYDSDAQKISFLSHIESSQKSGLPLIVHSRNADLAVSEILKSEMGNAHFKVLIHCFSGDRDFLKTILDLNGYISISGIVTFNSAKALQDVVRYIPMNRLLIETDAPYLAPEPYRGKINEPSFLPYIATKIGQIMCVSFEEVCIATSNNFFNLFSRATKVQPTKV